MVFTFKSPFGSREADSSVSLMDSPTSYKSTKDTKESKKVLASITNTASSLPDGAAQSIRKASREAKAQFEQYTYSVHKQDLLIVSNSHVFVLFRLTLMQGNEHGKQAGMSYGTMSP